MTKKILAFTILLVISGLALFWWTQRVKPPTSSGASSGGQEEVTPAPLRVRAAARASSPVHREADPEGALRLEGQVIGEDNAGVGGARVAISSMPPRYVTTEQDGSFVFEGLMQKDYSLEAHSEGLYAPPLAIRLQADSEPAILRLRAGRSLALKILGGQGEEPVVGALVEVRSGMDWYAGLSWQGQSDADGRVQLAGLPSSELSLRVVATGFAAYSARLLAPAAGTSEEQRVVLQAGVPVHGVLVDESGNPVAGATVAALSASEPFPLVDPRRDGVLTDAEGVFTLPQVVPGSYRFVISHEQMVAKIMSPISMTAESSPIRLVATRGASLEGRVLDQAGLPVLGAEVGFVVQGSVPWRTRRRAVTDDSGSFRFASLPSGQADLVATSASASSAIVVVSLEAGAVSQVDLALSISARIAGLVVDSEGEILPEAQVFIEPLWTGALGERNQWQARESGLRIADAGGAFAFSGLPPGTYQVRAAAQGADESALYLAQATQARAGQVDLRLVAAGEATLSGRLLYSDGSAVPLFTLHLGAGVPIAFADKDGRFSMRIPTGDLNLRFSGPSFAPKTVSMSSSPSEAVDLGTISVERGRSVSGIVLDEGGSPVAAAQVAAGALLTGDGTKLFIEDESIMARTTSTDQEGRFAFDGFGQHAITVVAGLDSAGRSRALQIPAGVQGSEVTLTLEPTSSLRGVISRDGKPIAETVVIATPIGTTTMSFVVTGADGSYAYDTLTPGEYIVYPMIGGGGNRPKDMFIKTVEIESGKAAVRDIEAVSGPGKLVVSVVDAEGKATAAHVLVLAEKNAPSAPGTIDQFLDGSWLHGLDPNEEAVAVYLRQARGEPADVEALAAGTYSACALRQGTQPGPPSGAMACKSIELSTAGVTRVDLELPPVDVDQEPH